MSAPNGLPPLGIDPAIVLKQIEQFASQYREMFLRFAPFIMAGMIYISFLVMSQVYYRPSFNACLSTVGTPMMICTVLANAMFFVYLLYFFAKQIFPTSFEGLGHGAEIALCVSVFLIIVLNGYLFFTCNDKSSCDNGCDPATLTLFNDRVIVQVNNLPILKSLDTYFRTNLLPMHGPISACSLIYDGSFRRPNSTCGVATMTNGRGPPCDATNAPSLSCFFVCSSNKTCMVNSQSDGYVTDKMIGIALAGGARLLDFDIYAMDFSSRGVPVVGIRNKRNNNNRMHNFVTLERCFQTINSVYLAAGTAAQMAGALPQDPLFLHLNLRESASKTTMDNVARLVLYYFQQFSGSFLLDPSYHYKTQKNLGAVPICALLGKVIILVTTPPGILPSPMLDEIINGWTGSAYTLLSPWTEIRDSAAPPDVIQYTKYKLNLVPSSPAGTGWTQQPSLNNDSQVALNLGCQFVMMNFQTLDGNLLAYLGYFEKCSFVLKPQELLKEPPTMSDACDPDNMISDPSLRSTHCETIRQQDRSATTQENIDATQASMANMVYGAS